MYNKKTKKIMQTEKRILETPSVCLGAGDVYQWFDLEDYLSYEHLVKDAYRKILGINDAAVDVIYQQVVPQAGFPGYLAGLALLDYTDLPSGLVQITADNPPMPTGLNRDEIAWLSPMVYDAVDDINNHYYGNDIMDSLTGKNIRMGEGEVMEVIQYHDDRIKSLL